jgi:hypothetical protein
MNMSILVLSGVLSGPVSSFLLEEKLYPVLLVFPLAGILTLGKGWLRRLLLLEMAPLTVLLLGLLTGNGPLVDRSARWCFALASGMYFAGALDSSRLSSIIRRFTPPRGPIGDFMRNLVMLISLAGPSALLVRRSFTECRRKGCGFLESVEQSLVSLNELEEHPGDCNPPAGGFRSACLLAGASWLLMLAGIAGIEVFA